MPLRTQSGFLLPPRPRAADWTYAGSSAGIILGISELLVAYPAGSPPPPPVALLIIGANAVLVGVISALLGLALRLSRRRVSHSGMVGATLGPLLAAAIAGSLWQHAPLSGMSTALFLSGLATALMLAVAASLAGMRLGEALERGALALSGPFVWFAIALPLAAAERVLWLQTGKTIEALALIGMAFLVVAIAMAAFEWVRRRGSRTPKSFARITTLLTLGAIALAFLPWARPWVLSDYELPALDAQGPPNLLVVALGAVPASAAIESESDLALFALAGVTYEQVQLEGPSGVCELLVTPDGTSVPLELAADGYAVAAIVADSERASTLEGVEKDATPGAQRLLAEPFGWMASASLLAGPGNPLLATLNLGATYRTPDQITGAAKRWLSSWRMQRAPAPFFLYVDFGAPDRADPRDAAEAGLLELLEQLQQLDVNARTAIVVANDPYPGWTANSDSPTVFSAVLRPAADRPKSTRGVRVRQKISSRDLGAALLEMANREPGAAPRALPGQ